MTTERIDVLAVMDEAASGLSLADERSYGAGDDLRRARAAVAELIDAHKRSVEEIERLRGSMFDVYATCHNEGDVLAAVERMRDVMDAPWSVDSSRAALARVHGGAP